jgi:hypothetical protein
MRKCDREPASAAAASSVALPKRAAPKRDAAAPEPAKAHVSAASRSSGGIGRLAPAVAKPKPYAFDPRFGIDKSLEDIPW